MQERRKKERTTRIEIAKSNSRILIERVEYFSLSRQDCTSYLSNLASTIIACGDIESIPAKCFRTRYRQLPWLTYFTYCHLSYLLDCIHYCIAYKYAGKSSRTFPKRNAQITTAGGNAPTIEDCRKRERDDPLRAPAKRAFAPAAAALR